MNSKVNLEPLIEAARSAKLQAFAPITHFRVGAAVLSDTGKIIKGCNVEISNLSLTMCAERNAIFSSISCGEKNLIAIAITSDSPSILSPCGSCRQVMHEIMGDAPVFLIASDNEVVERRVSELLRDPPVLPFIH